MIQLFKPYICPVKKYSNFLKDIDRSMWYANFGPLYSKFKYKLSKHFKISDQNIELFSNGTSAIIAALQSLKDVNKPYCLVPSWTFVATVQAIINAGMTPYFIDIDPETMHPGEDSFKMVPKSVINKTSVILLVAPFGKPIDDKLTNYFQNKYKTPVLIDAAAGFDSCFNKKQNIVFSLHATKIFGIGEGGLFTSPNKKLLSKARSFSNFGFQNQRDSKQHGINCKISEIHCAVGLGMIDSWKDIRMKYKKKSNQYIKMLNTNYIKFSSGWGVKYLTSTCTIKCKNTKIKNLIKKEFSNKNIAYRDWWGAGCHNNIYFKKYLRNNQKLINTDHLARTTLGIPFHIHLTQNSISSIFKILNKDYN